MLSFVLTDQLNSENRQNQETKKQIKYLHKLSKDFGMKSSIWDVCKGSYIK